MVAQGLFHVTKLIAEIENKDSTIPEAARQILPLLVEQFRSLDEKVAMLDREIARRARDDAEAKRLMTIPGIGPISATAVAALAPSAKTFKRGRDFAARLGLTPLQRSSGGKQKLGETSRMGERTLRRLLIIGASATVRVRCGGRSLALAHAESQAAHAGDHCSGQQDGTYCVGTDGQGRDLPGTGLGGIVRSSSGLPKCKKVERRVWRYGQ